ncbi:MAG: 4-vinyl reductase [Candidatus Micrarchaeaceae archaeon]
MATRRMPEGRANYYAKSAKSKKSKNRKTRVSRHLHRNHANRNPLRKLGETAVATYNANDLEEALISDMLAKNSGKVSTDSMVIPRVIYNATATMRNFAYNSGFSVGRILYAKGSNMNSLLGLLESSGLGKILYYPFDDSSVFVGKPKASMELGVKAHVYEAGILAGYLSASTGTAIAVQEKYCVHNGDAFCQFIAEPKEAANASNSAEKNLNNVVETLAAAIAHSSADVEAVNEDYYLLYMLPLLEKSITESLYKVLYATGSKIAEYAKNSNMANDKLLSSMSKTTGAEGVNFVKRNGFLRGISIKYGMANSIGSLVNGYAALFAGMVKDLYNSGVEIKRELGANNSYVLRMRLKPG